MFATVAADRYVAASPSARERVVKGVCTRAGIIPVRSSNRCSPALSFVAAVVTASRTARAGANVKKSTRDMNPNKGKRDTNVKKTKGGTNPKKMASRTPVDFSQ
ncbi:hypothetical protein QE412_001142 [Microbacterium trichothecenolyticum]|uniref:Uncharacterized protein n=1 Tax=Microbacterium trichothecenolyticum TaxID=69370 RepID=A0ABU0TUE6_MICTR|nr:hypothetical protein [Microbacterium trichothecenolyticum]